MVFFTFYGQLGFGGGLHSEFSEVFAVNCYCSETVPLF